MPRRLSPLIAALCLGACMPSFKPIDLGKPLTDRELALAFSKGANGDADDFSEQLVVRAVLDDEATIYVKLTVTNLATADGRADLTVSVKLADGRVLRFKERRDRGEWTFARDRFMAEVGDGRVELGVGRVHVVAQNDEFAIDFEVTTALPPLRPRGGTYDRGGRFYVTTIPVPRGAARATVDVLVPPEGDWDEGEDEGEDGDAPPEAPPEAPGETPVGGADAPAPEGGADETAPPADNGGETWPQRVELEGLGYAEHRAGNVAPYALARRWYSILDIGEDETVMLSVFEHAPAEGAPRDPGAPPGPVQGFFYATGDEAMKLYEPEIDLRVRGWRSDEKTSYPIPEVVFVSDVKRSSFEGVIVAGPLSDRKDDLGGLSRLERIVVRKFMKPWTFRFDRARYLFRRQEPGEAMREIRGEKRLQVQQLN